MANSNNRQSEKRLSIVTGEANLRAVESLVVIVCLALIGKGGKLFFRPPTVDGWLARFKVK